MDFALYLVAFVLFILAGANVPAGVRWEWFGAAALVLTLIV